MTHIHNTHVILHSSLIKASSGPFEATSRNSSPVLSPTTQPRQLAAYTSLPLYTQRIDLRYAWNDSPNSDIYTFLLLKRRAAPLRPPREILVRCCHQQHNPVPHPLLNKLWNWNRPNVYILYTHGTIRQIAGGRFTTKSGY